MIQRKPPPRRRLRRKDARPGEILDAAFAEFAEKGFLATRLDDVAIRAGVAKGTIYLYYPNKEALFEAAVRSRILPILGTVGGVIETFDGPSDELLRRLIGVFYGKLADPDVRTIMRIMIGEGHMFPALVEFYHREFMSKAVALMKGVLARGIERGEFAPSAVLDTPEVIMGPGILAAIWQMVFAPHRPIPLAEFERAHVALVLDGLMARRLRR